MEKLPAQSIDQQMESSVQTTRTKETTIEKLGISIHEGMEQYHTRNERKNVHTNRLSHSNILATNVLNLSPLFWTKNKKVILVEHIFLEIDS